MNKINKEVLKERLAQETFKRRTISFYRYVKIKDPVEFRDMLFVQWNAMQCFGRIYVAREGINAQMSLPENVIPYFLEQLEKITELKGVPIKYAIQDDGKSFYKLTIKVRSRIVADGLEEGSYDVTNVGNHLSAVEFHKAIDDPEALVIDMRNHYESEIGKFEKAYCPDADTFREAIGFVAKRFDQDKNKKLLLYCTGGIRCEKASAYLKHLGFSNVNQLYGGIIEYAQQVKFLGLSSRFNGRNFVFDERLGESVDNQIIAQCHQCGKPADTHTNCANNDCHLLFIQCSACSKQFNGCCSDDCMQILTLPEAEQRKFRVLRHEQYAASKIFKSRLRPVLKMKPVTDQNMSKHG